MQPLVGSDADTTYSTFFDTAPDMNHQAMRIGQLVIVLSSGNDLHLIPKSMADGYDKIDVIYNDSGYGGAFGYKDRAIDQLSVTSWNGVDCFVLGGNPTNRIQYLFGYLHN